MRIVKKSLSWYADKIRNDEIFSFPGYSDVEWNCMFSKNIGEYSALGQLQTEEIGKELIKSMKVRDKNYLKAMPECLFDIPGWKKEDIDNFCVNHSIYPEFYERDMVLDIAAENAELKPLIDAVKNKPVHFIGNKELRRVPIKYDTFFEISTPNFHLEGKTNELVERVLTKNREGVYFISAGVSAAVIISKLHGMIPAWFIDTGSIWDAFVGIGGQRDWRAQLYKNKKLWKKWIQKNV